MSAQADTNCHNIFNAVSTTRTHLAKIGATCHVVPTCHDMSATFPAKRSNANVYAVPSRHYVVDRYRQSHIELVCTLTLMEESDMTAINAIDYPNCRNRRLLPPLNLN